MTSIPRETAPVTDADELLQDFYVDAAPPSQNGAGYHEDSAGAAAGDVPPDSDPTQESAQPGDEAQLPYWQTQLHTLETFLQRPKKVWLVDRILGAGDFVLLFGESGHGKTHAVIDFAFSCLTGNTFADTFSIVRPMTVAYATGEGVSGLSDRLRAVAQHYGRTDVPLYIFSDIPQLYERTSPPGAVAFIHAWRAMADAGQVPAQLDVLILDTLHNATAGADENSARDVSTIMQTLRLLRDALGCAIVLVHHSNKAGTDYRGSSSLKGAMDTMLRSQKTGDGNYLLACEKSKDGEAWQAQKFELAQVGDGSEGVRVQWTGVASGTGSKKETHAAKCVAFLRANAGSYYTADDITREIGLSPDNAKNVLADLRQLVTAGTVQRDGAGKRGAPYRFSMDLLADDE